MKIKRISTKGLYQFIGVALAFHASVSAVAGTAAPDRASHDCRMRAALKSAYIPRDPNDKALNLVYGSVVLEHNPYSKEFSESYTLSVVPYKCEDGDCQGLGPFEFDDVRLLRKKQSTRDDQLSVIEIQSARFDSFTHGLVKLRLEVTDDVTGRMSVGATQENLIIETSDSTKRVEMTASVNCH